MYGIDDSGELITAPCATNSVAGSRAAHTSGSWTVYPFREPAPTNGCLIYSGEQLVADCNFTRNWLERNANARLIAAAPDMLTALQVIATTHDEDNEWDGRDKFRALRDYARSTVAKVTAT